MVGVMSMSMAACGSTSSTSSAASSVSTAATSEAAVEETTEETTGTEASYTTSFNMNNGNLDGLPDYQFLPMNVSGLLGYENRMYDDITLTLNADGTYVIDSNAYCMQDGKLIEVGAEEGIGFVCHMVAQGTYELNEDGTVTTSKAESAEYEIEGDTYSVQMVQMGLWAVEGEEKGTYDSADYPQILDWVPATIFTVGDSGEIVSFEAVDPTDVPWHEAEEETEEVAATSEEATEEATEEVTASSGEESESAAAFDDAIAAVTSDDGGTMMYFFADGTYIFRFEDYDISDEGTYAYDAEAGTLTLTDANGSTTEAEVNEGYAAFHYVCSLSDQLTGDFTMDLNELNA